MPVTVLAEKYGLILSGSKRIICNEHNILKILKVILEGKSVEINENEVDDLMVELQGLGFSTVRPRMVERTLRCYCRLVAKSNGC